MKDILLTGAAALGLTLTPTQATRCAEFGAAMLEKNQVMNLTAITQPEAVAQLHFLDSLALLKLADFQNASVVDVGCGAGFPGVPLKIGDPTIRLTLLDSLAKRIRWLSETLPALGIEATCVSARAEEFAAAHREQYDIATSRAVARLPILCELCLPLVKPGGWFLAMKGAETALEADEARRAISLLGGKLVDCPSYTVGDVTHYVVRIQKIKPTPTQYPRRYTKIKQSPL